MVLTETSRNMDQLAKELAAIQLKQEAIKESRPHDIFKPMPGGQTQFYCDKRKEKWIFGGNQSGKTTTSVNYVHEKMKIPKQRWYFGSTSFDKSQKVVQKKFWEWANKDDLDPRSRYKDDKGFPDNCCMFLNGSVVFFLSYEQDQDKWSGDSVHGVMFDEEPPWHIFTEAQKRIIAYDGEIIGAMTALKSYTRLVNRVYLEPNRELIGLFTVPIHQNHVKHGGQFTDERISRIIEETPALERLSRIYGIPTYKTGLVYDEWEDKWPWVIPAKLEFEILDHWTRYVGIDPHAHINQAALMIAVSPKGNMYAYKEIWQKCLIPKFAKILREESTPIEFEASLIDNHYATQKNAETGKNIKELIFEYGDIATIGGCDDVIARIDMVKAWDRINPATGKPLLQIFESCTQSRWERKRYEWQAPISEKVAERRDAPQKPKDKNGHLMNCLEYLAAFGGKGGLEYVEPPLSAAMQRRHNYYKKREAEENAQREYDSGQEYTDPFMESCSRMYA